MTVSEMDVMLAEVTLSEVVEVGAVSLEELAVVEATVGTTVTTCGLEEVVGSSCVVVAGCGVVDAAAVCWVLPAVVMPKMLLARLSMGENMSRT